MSSRRRFRLIRDHDEQGPWLALSSGWGLIALESEHKVRVEMKKDLTRDGHWDRLE
jgi:hypothetical protein